MNEIHPDFELIILKNGFKPNTRIYIHKNNRKKIIKMFEDVEGGKISPNYFNNNIYKIKQYYSEKAYREYVKKNPF